MKTFAITVLAAITLAGPTLSAAGSKPVNSGSKPSSYAPQPHTNRHVYGTPLQPPIVHHANTSHHKHAQKKRSTSATTRGAPAALVHHDKAKAPP
jgi:hypothetical protein